MIAFMLRPGEDDEGFCRLNVEIQAATLEADDDVGQETWVSPDGTTKNAVSYWNTMAGLRAFADVASQGTAKAQYRRWYEGYQIVIAEVTETYGDGRLPHVTRR